MIPQARENQTSKVTQLTSEAARLRRKNEALENCIEYRYGREARLVCLLFFQWSNLLRERRLEIEDIAQEFQKRYMQTCQEVSKQDAIIRSLQQEVQSLQRHLNPEEDSVNEWG